MDYLRNWREYIPQERLYFLVAVVAIMVIGLADVLLVRFSVVARWQDKRELASQLASARQALAEAKRAQEESPEEFQKQVATAEATLNDVASTFLSDSQVSEALDSLYQYASESRVGIVNLECQRTPEEEEKGAYDVGKCRLQAEGYLPDLMDFVSRVEEAVFKSFVMTNVSITEGKEQHVLSMDIALYTSPFSSGAVVQPTPVATAPGTPAPTPVGIPWATPVPTGVATPTGTPVPPQTVEEQLAQRLHAAWAAEDWEEAIRLIEQILAINPDYDDMTEKLYAAHVNYGHKLAAEGRLEEAKVEFTRALDIKPDGGAAIAGLQGLAGETPTPPLPTPTQGQYTIHVVQPGENLFRIALRYGTTVQAIMAANGLTDYSIHAGQQLRIPIR